MRKYTTTEKIGKLYDMTINQNEVKEINNLLSSFDEDDMELINRVCEINFKIGFRVANELTK
ncbi:MAG: hypothetical protein ACRC1T_11960 [Clostridium chrysemydis]|uniref:hypothetical protein n=1 Tax=Clostridium chrysemydis TaxID=2665504 RepID=UPI003F30467E